MSLDGTAHYVFGTAVCRTTIYTMRQYYIQQLRLFLHYVFVAAVFRTTIYTMRLYYIQKLILFSHFVSFAAAVCRTTIYILFVELLLIHCAIITIIAFKII